MEKMGTLKKKGDQKTHFGPHGDQSPQMGTNVGAVPHFRVLFWITLLGGEQAWTPSLYPKSFRHGFSARWESSATAISEFG